MHVQIPELTRYKSVVLPLNRQLTHCSWAVIENKNLFLTDLPSKIKINKKKAWDVSRRSAVVVSGRQTEDLSRGTLIELD